MSELRTQEKQCFIGIITINNTCLWQGTWWQLKKHYALPAKSKLFLTASLLTMSYYSALLWLHISWAEGAREREGVLMQGSINVWCHRQDGETCVRGCASAGRMATDTIMQMQKTHCAEKKARGQSGSSQHSLVILLGSPQLSRILELVLISRRVWMRYSGLPAEYNGVEFNECNLLNTIQSFCLLLSFI